MKPLMTDSSIFSRLDAAADKAMRGEGASSEEALFLAARAPLPSLKEAAGKIRERFFGNSLQLCSIINARSGACSEDCRFCAQSARYETGAKAYPLLDGDAMIQAARKMAGSGAASFSIVTSGPSISFGELRRIAAAVEKITADIGFNCCASLGKLDESQLRRLKSSGLKRYHHNLETSRAFFPSICSTHTWEERVETARAAQKADLPLCCGGLFGMGESWEDRVALAMTLRELDVDSVPINFLVPVPGTPLGRMRILSPEEALRIIALYRLLLPRATLRVCGGRIAALRGRQKEMFAAGANGLMIGDYLTTPGADIAADRKMIADAGFVFKGIGE
jgi:biotin synthase